LRKTAAAIPYWAKMTAVISDWYAKTADDHSMFDEGDVSSLISSIGLAGV